MSTFSRDAKDEVAAIRNGRACCQATFARALFSLGVIRRRAGRRVCVISSGRASVARAVVAAAHSRSVDVHAQRAPGAPPHGRWSIDLPAAPPGPLPRRTCCLRALLRAAFLACGSVNDPSRGYHLEFFCHADSSSRLVGEIVARLGVDAGVTRRRGRALVYVKDAQDVSTLLGHLGASHAVLRLEAARALHQTKNSIRRTVNGEAANAARSAASAARQRAAARRILGRRPSLALRPVLLEAARLRVTHPSRTLAELARIARPPITKSAMANRLRLLERLADR